MPDFLDVAEESVFGQGRQMMLAQMLRGQNPMQSFAPQGGPTPAAANPAGPSVGAPPGGLAGSPGGQPRPLLQQATPPQRENPADLYTQAEEIRKRAYGLAPDPQVEQAEREKANANAFYGSAINTLGGSRLAPTGGHILKQAMQRQSELERNPERDLTRRQQALLAEAASFERRAQSAQSAEEREFLLKQAQAATLAAQRERAQDRAAQMQVAQAGIAANRDERKADREALAASGRTDRIRNEYQKSAGKIQEGTAFAGNVLQLLSDPKVANSAEGQLALTFAYGKMLDPDSVVRESEQQMIANARGWLDSIGMTRERIMSGARLTPDQRAEMARVATMYQQGTRQRVSDLQTDYTGLAQRNRLPVEDIIIGRRATDQPSPSAPSAPKPGGTIKFGDL